MRIIAALFSILSLSIAKSQVVDSAWIAKNYLPKLIQDTGLYLPDVKLVDEKGETRKISEFKGKVLFIDVWTTWCGNCLINFPHSEQLYKRLKSIHLDTLIQFITVCTEDSEKEWKKKIKKIKPTGINLFGIDPLSLYRSWKISSFPRYIILDSSGKILCTDFPGPADGMVDYILFAATKGIKPSESIWVILRQQQYFITNRKFTDDNEGIDYSKWYYSTVESKVEYFKWVQSRNQHSKTKANK